MGLHYWLAWNDIWKALVIVLLVIVLLVIVLLVIVLILCWRELPCMPRKVTANWARGRDEEEEEEEEEGKRGEVFTISLILLFLRSAVKALGGQENVNAS